VNSSLFVEITYVIILIVLPFHLVRFIMMENKKSLDGGGK
jgi:hypothetical protein